MEEFFNNAARYPRFLITITLGILLTLFSPLLPLFKRPSTAIAAVAFVVAGLVFIAFTLRAMLELNAV
ncbi:MAG TPA: DUF751 family protein [Coleofasciculaceae cyanobacterium]